MNDAKVFLWGSQVGTITWLADRSLGVFQYAPDFIRSGIQLSPLTMPLNEFPYEFPALAQNTFKGLPGLLADSLPDKFGNAVMGAWLASQGRALASVNPVERLSYIGSRGMGGFEFMPEILVPYSNPKEIEITILVKISNKILDQRTGLEGGFDGNDNLEAMEDLVRVGTPAGGSRAKAVLAWNPTTNKFCSGQIAIPPGYEHWLIKFDGICNNRDKEMPDPQGYGKIEYAYHLMALEAGIEMAHCRLYHEGGRSHFMTKRFDKTDDGIKLHMQSLGAIAHGDFNKPAKHSYEQAIQIMKKLGLPQKDWEQQVLRAMFNVVGRNQDDHVKNIAFLMNPEGEWRLSQAFDVSYAYDPKGDWTNKHQMGINGKRDMFNCEDLCSLAKIAGMTANRACEMLDHVLKTMRLWPDIADKTGVDENRILQIQANQRLSLLD